ncbi:MAG: hypothetical protein QM729_21210 [Solirubrobacterales bacterium]
MSALIGLFLELGKVAAYLTAFILTVATIYWVACAAYHVHEFMRRAIRAEWERIKAENKDLTARIG